MFFRKIRSAFFSSLILPFIFILAGFIQSVVTGDPIGSEELSSSGFLLIVFLYAALGNFFYGIPVSYISDFITKKTTTFRFVLAGFIHIGFGFLTTIILEGFGLFAVACSILFFLLEEFQRSRKEQKQRTSIKKTLIHSVVIVLYALGAYFGVDYISNTQYSETVEKTNKVYLIPKGYEGSITVFYNVTNYPSLQREGELQVIPVRVESLVPLKETEMEQHGIYFTSDPEHQSGRLVNDLYYYVDEKGQRTAIDEKCVHVGNSGSTIMENGKETQFTSLQVTESECGKKFQVNGKAMYTIQSSEAEKYWIEKLTYHEE
ncbi:hypothetical protein FZW96_08105 [Bacillus sp. BGMRC 2118]|nr:hypothetical protein FZW96_08105 [Bacillus sp. BGMRC 2118]